MFGDSAAMYCPWDILLYISELRKNPFAPPKAYWRNTCSNDIIKRLLSAYGDQVKVDLEKLIHGGSVRLRISENISFDSLYSSEKNIWSILYLTGYLTKSKEINIEVAQCYSDEFTLVIPNAEIREIFVDASDDWFEEIVAKTDRNVMFSALWSEDENILTCEISRFLMKTISYFDYHENFYHAFLDGIFAGSEYDCVSNKETGLGSSDIILKDFKN